MSCELTQAFAWDCRVESAGIKAIYLVEYSAADTVTKASGEISAHSLDGGRSYFKWELEKVTANMTSNTLVSQENGTVAYETILVVKLHGITQAKINELKLAAKTRLRIIVRDNEDNYWMLGAETGVDMTARTSESGTQFNDFKGSTVTFRHYEWDDINKVQAAVVTSLSLS